MILIRASLRVSFGGGGTDLPAYFERHGGFVVSASISRYTYALVEETGDDAGSVTSADYGLRFTWRPSRLPPAKAPLTLAKAALHELAERGALDPEPCAFARVGGRAGVGAGIVERDGGGPASGALCRAWKPA